MEARNNEIIRGVGSIADVEAIEATGVPSDLPNSTYDMLRRGAELDPTAPALSFFLSVKGHKRPEVWSYAEFLAQVTQAANLFHSLGVGKDDVVAYVLPNLPETHFTIWGGQAAGIVAAINPLLEPSAIAELLNATGARVLVTLAPFPGVDLWQKIHQVLPLTLGIEHLVLVNMADRVKAPGKLVARIVQWAESCRLHAPGGLHRSLPPSIQLHDFNKATSAQPSRHLVSGRSIEPEDFSSYFCTGGTTGTPKIAMRRHRNEVFNAWSAARFQADNFGQGKTVLCGLPLFHVNGVLVTGLVPFSKGAHVLLATPQGYRAEGIIERFWEIVDQHRINFFSGVPTLFASLLQVPIEDHDVSSLEYALCGAAPMPREVLRSFQERTGLKILEGYGLTEGTCASTTNPPLGETKTGSIGLRLPFQNMRVVELDDDGGFNRICGVGEVGVIALNGPNVFAGYKVQEHNKGIWLDLGDGEKWLNTGDLGWQDSDGFFYLTGRKKELIIRGGHNIDPLIIEEPLHRHPAVQTAAAVGRPDAYAGEVPVAYVQLKSGAAVTERELLAFAEQNIAERAARPKGIRIVNEMPLTGVGKIFKPALKRIEIEHAILDELNEAGVGVSEVLVSEDSNKGLVLKISLLDASKVDIAGEILGKFPFSIKLKW
ncbi:acyl-CoA synthetase [Marinobacter sp. SS21]|uniref:acyl-CoA synthetase n=1 Tax=Marinobacter sp. SS21 TaxID=2979460 RepID=UPI00232B8035|nr:acyl-CoA synthetase [Marinobacter sp. SS21]MDC0661449.1 acyl-CoA synthetase [Marinobacter sp. SS21]